jgi:hypothetical protein
MNSDLTPPASKTGGDSIPQRAPKKRSWLLMGCGGLIALLLIVVATVAITLWWLQRPIKPVVLSAKEKAVVEQKLQRLGGGTNGLSPRAAGRDTAPTLEPTSRYTAGSRTFQLTERELNGLLNANTDLGKTVRLELDRDAINAYLAVPIPQDFPIGGGKMFRAKGRFHMSLSKDQAPVAMLEDVTVLGLSLPKEWLGGVKGKNLLADAMGGRSDALTWKGIKSLRIVPGAIVLEVGD